MRRDLPPLPWLRAFEAAARHLSFTQAATELGLTQAAISKQIKLLEEHLRQPLFIRKTRRVELTKDGEAYLPKLRDAFERLEAGTREVFGPRRGDTLTIRANNSFALNWLTPRLTEFFDLHPDVPLRILNSVWSDNLDRSRIDLDIQYGTGQWPGFQADQLTADTLTPVCDAETAALLTHPEQLQDHRLFHVLGYEEGWAHWLTAAGVPGLTGRFETQVDSSLMAFDLASRGAGVALGRKSLLENQLTAHHLVQPFEIETEAKESFYLLSPAGAPLHKHAPAFANWIKSVTR